MAWVAGLAVWDMLALMSMLGEGGGKGGGMDMASMMGGNVGGMGGKGGSKGAPPEDDAEKSGGEGKWHWNQKYQVRRDSCAEFLFDRSAATKKDIKVKFKATPLRSSLRPSATRLSTVPSAARLRPTTVLGASRPTRWRLELQVMLTKVEGKTEAWPDLPWRESVCCCGTRRPSSQ